MEQVLDVYERPYDSEHPVVCLDESPQQLIGEMRDGFMDEKGVIYQDYEYVRNGVADIYMVCEPLAGKREIFVTENHCAKQWAEVVTYIADEMYPQAETITLVQDNLSAHKIAALYEIHLPEKARSIVKRLNIVFTPKHGSWLNMAEIELGVFKRMALKTRTKSKEELIQRVKAYEQNRNKQEKKIDWQFKTKDARVKLKRLYPII
jgi:transposase